MPKALFTKTVIHVYQYETEVEDVSMYQDKDNDLYDTFSDDTLVDITWYVDVEEVNG
jgi:hypothetical protein